MPEQKSIEEQQCTFIDDLYLENLKLIDNVVFTSREIDILACILNNRASKKISSFLLISPRTVENHIRNIMLKLECNSRESIIDFIENSDQAQLFKNHYNNLLTKAKFHTDLKQISTEIKYKNIHCKIFYSNIQNKKDIILEHIIQDLKLVGLNVSTKAWEINQAKIGLPNNTGLQTTQHIIYYLNKNFIETIQSAKYAINEETSSIATMVEKNSDTVLFVLPNKDIKFKEQPTFSNISFVYLTEQANYYSFIYAILNKILPNENINKYIHTFNKRPALLKENTTLQPKQLEYSLPETKNIYNYKHLWFWLTILALITCTSIVLLFTKNKLNITRTTQNITASTTEKLLLNLPPRNINFTGRNLVLEQITLQLNKQKTGVITQAIAGLGGVGKTQLATEFAYLAAEKKDYSAIFWISAETNNAICSTYKEIASYLQLDVLGLELANIQNLVHNKIAAIYKNHKILLILDNVPDHDYINDYLAKIHKELSPYLTSHVLITSRAQYWPTTPIILDIFSPKEALDFVQKLLPDEKTINIEKLTATLHYFPLALGQAVAYIKKHTNINDYLKLYADKQQNYLDTFPEDKNQHHESLWKTWNISLNKLSNTAIELLCIAAYLDPDNIPLAFFEHITTEARANGIKELRNYSLITMINNNQSFKVHRLLQEVIRLSIKSNSNQQNKFIKTESYWLAQAMDLLKTKFDFDVLRPKYWKHWSSYLNQAELVANHAIKSSGISVKYGLRLYIKSAMSFTYINYDIKHSISIWQKISSLIQRQYKNPLAKFILAHINLHLGYIQNYAGRARKTSSLLRENIPILKQSIPNIKQEERDLLDLLRLVPFRNNTNDFIKERCDLHFALMLLGNAKYKLGSIQEAIKTYNKAINILEDNSLEKISQYYKIDTLGDLGLMHIYAGNFVMAKKILFQAELDGNRLYANNPRQAHIYANIALLNYHLGQFGAAIQILYKCSKIRLASLSPQHIRIADTKLNLGLVFHMIGNNSLALKNLTQAKIIYKLHFNDDHTHKGILINLGFWKIYEDLEEYNMALNYMKTTVKIAKLRYKDKMKSIMAFQLSEAEIWPQLTKHSDLSYWQQALKTTQQIFGYSHYQSARYHYMLAQALEQAHKQQDANHHYQQALAILNSQEIRHPNLQQFYTKNTAAIQAGITRTWRA